MCVWGQRKITYTLPNNKYLHNLNSLPKQKLRPINTHMKFSTKLALTVSISVVLTFVVIDIIMHVIYALIISQYDTSSDESVQVFNTFSNQQVLKTWCNYIATSLAISEQVISQIYIAYKQFTANPQIETSFLQRGVNPPLTDTFTRPRYDRSSIYFYTENSTFYDEPFVDKSISSTAIFESVVATKRVNIIYQS